MMGWRTWYEGLMIEYSMDYGHTEQGEQQKAEEICTEHAAGRINGTMEQTGFWYDVDCPISQRAPSRKGDHGRV